MKEISTPASKSLSHRILLATALASAPSKIHNLLSCNDTRCTAELLTKLGTRIEEGPHQIWTVWPKLQQPHTCIQCNVQESGSTCRILAPVFAAVGGQYRFFGAPRLSQRPVYELTQALRSLGSTISFEQKEYYPPFTIQSTGFHPSRQEVFISLEESSQHLSGLLFAATLSEQAITFSLIGKKIVSWPYILLSLACLEEFGIQFVIETRPSPEAIWQETFWKKVDSPLPYCFRITVFPSKYRAHSFSIEGDWSNASYFLAAGLLGKEAVRVKGISAHSLQGDSVFLQIISAMGAKLSFEKNAIISFPSPLHGITIDMHTCPDLVPTVAILAACAEGESQIENIGHLRIKECDRLHAVALVIQGMGRECEEGENSLSIRGRKKVFTLGREKLSSFNDHRMVMAQALLALQGKDIDPKKIDEYFDRPEVVNKSFPQFWKTWKSIC